MKDIIKEVINEYIVEEGMIKEFKNPKFSETLNVCADMLQRLHDDAVKNGMSKREITVKKIGEIADELRKLGHMTSV